MGRARCRASSPEKMAPAAFHDGRGRRHAVQGDSVTLGRRRAPFDDAANRACGASGNSASINEGPDHIQQQTLAGVHPAPPRTRACLRYRTNRGRKSSSDPVSFRRRSPRGLQGGIAAGVLGTGAGDELAGRPRGISFRR